MSTLVATLLFCIGQTTFSGPLFAPPPGSPTEEATGERPIIFISEQLIRTPLQHRGFDGLKEAITEAQLELSRWAASPSSRCRSQTVGDGPGGGYPIILEAAEAQPLVFTATVEDKIPGWDPTSDNIVSLLVFRVEEMLKGHGMVPKRPTHLIPWGSMNVSGVRLCTMPQSSWDPVPGDEVLFIGAHDVQNPGHLSGLFYRTEEDVVIIPPPRHPDQPAVESVSKLRSRLRSTQ